MLPIKKDNIQCYRDINKCINNVIFILLCRVTGICIFASPVYINQYVTSAKNIIRIRQGRTRGAPMWGGALLILHLIAFSFLRQSTFYIAFTQTKRLRKETNYILIYNNTLQSNLWSGIALSIRVSHFENWLSLFVVSLQNWLKITHVFHLSITSYNKKSH